MKITTSLYKILNTVTGDFYIGSTTNMRIRMLGHLSKLGRNAHPNIHLQRAWNKYGEKNFEFKVILVCEEFELLRYEQLLLDIYNPAYNICKTAGATRGRKNSDFQKKRASESNLGIPRSTKVREKIRNSLLGMKHTAERNKNISLGRRGIPSIRKQGFSDDWGIEFTLVSPDNTVVTGRNLARFCRERKLNYSSIYNVINGYRKSNKGWKLV